MNRVTKLLCTAMEASAAGQMVTLPEGVYPLWRTFTALSRCRAYGPLGALPIPYSEIAAYARLMRVPLEPHHVETIMELDEHWLSMTKRSSAPVGVRSLPQRSEQPLTPAVFDAAMD